MSASQRPTSDTFDAVVLEAPISGLSAIAGRAASAGIMLLVAPLLIVVAFVARVFAAISGEHRD
ncbi:MULTISPECIES: hypothetical protein [unclassified Leifsonia]|uniref:hypothetical protein n=1 Tax=unclassified Leifsonia TaxID=2663824 RepID=UPI0006F8957D|nr:MULTISPECIES: hypothetical protein [unclassified Leifsonia]KQX05671.1 hypothetical protein ASC59_16500 [Leifsonia sp. Root1293]KRA09307.1 hypothetical protein ASD61_16495 [Leifsonia sp. Root60]